jgi:hypothetical protein
MQEFEVHYADIIDKGDLAVVQKTMANIPENGTEIPTDTALNIWDQFRQEYI